MRTLTLSRRRNLAVLLVVGLSVGVACLLLQSDTPHFDDTNFVATTVPTLGLPLNASLMDQVTFTWIKFFRKFRRPGPATSATYSFPPSATNLCSIHGLLNQCMEISGTRYLIAKEVAAGTVLFGHTNVLSGAQWVVAFEAVLQTGTPEWFDLKTSSFRKENLVLLRKDQKTVLVIPKDEALEFKEPAVVDKP